MTPKLKTRLGLYIPFALAGVAALGYTVVWNNAAGVVKDEITRFAEDETQTRQLAYDDVKVGGFPFFLKVDVENPRYAAPDDARAWRWSGERVTLHAVPFKPKEIVAQFHGPQNITFLDRPGVEARAPKEIHWRLASDSTRASFTAGKSGPENIALEVEEGEATRADAGLIAATTRFDRLIVRLEENKAENAEDDGFVLAGLSIEGFESAPEIAGQTPGALKLDAITAALTLEPLTMAELNALDGEALLAWSQTGGALTLEGLQIRSGETRLTASGGVDFDEYGFPFGELDARLERPQGLVDILAARGGVSAENAEAARVAIALMTLTTGEDALNAPLTLEGGDVRLGPVAIARLAPIR